MQPLKCQICLFGRCGVEGRMTVSRSNVAFTFYVCSFFQTRISGSFSRYYLMDFVALEDFLFDGLTLSDVALTWAARLSDIYWDLSIRHWTLNHA